jgi:HNH endonuclease
MDAALERLVRDRAGSRCEYCRLPHIGSRAPFEIDHIIPRKHRGRTVAGNLRVVTIIDLLPITIIDGSRGLHTAEVLKVGAVPVNRLCARALANDQTQQPAGLRGH